MKLDTFMFGICLFCSLVRSEAHQLHSRGGFSSTFSTNSTKIHEASSTMSLMDIVLPEFQEPLFVFPTGSNTLATASYFQKSTKTLFVAFYYGVLGKITDGATTMTTIATGLGYLQGVCVDPAGNIYAAGQQNGAIYKYSSDGELLSTTPFTHPYAIACDASGNVFVSERNANRVRKMDSSGAVSLVVGTGALGSTEGPVASVLIDKPIAVAVNAAGDVFFTEVQGKLKMLKNGIVSTIAGGGSGLCPTGPAGCLAKSYALTNSRGIWVNEQGDIYFTEDGPGLSRIYMVKKDSNGLYANSYMYVVAGAVRKASYALNNPVHVHGDDDGSIFVADHNNNRFVKFLDLNFAAASAPSATPSGVPSTNPTIVPSRVPSALPSIAPSASPSATPSVTPSSSPSEAPTLAVPEYSLTVSAKSFKYFEVRVFTGTNERVFPVSYDLVDCPENAGAVIWGHESTPVTEDTNTCVYGLPRHYWCECPALVNGNKPKLTLNFGTTVFDHMELLILDWEDGEVVVSDSANNIVLFSATRPGGPVVEEEFVRYGNLNLLQIAPSVVPTIAPSSVPTTKPSWTPTVKPTVPSVVPTQTPTVVPTTTVPSAVPTITPSALPSAAPSFTAQYTITLTAKTFKYFEVRVYTHDNLRIFPVSYELEHCPENAGVAVWNDQTTEDTNTCVYGYPRNFWCQCAAVADAKPKLVLHMGHTVFDRVELLLLNWEDGEVTVTDEANHETFLSATHDGVGNEFVTFGNLNLEHAAAAPVRRLLRGG